MALSEGRPLVVGNVKGEPGQNGVSVTGASLNASGELELTLSEGGPLVVGNVKGEPGQDGANGADAVVGGNRLWGINFSNGIQQRWGYENSTSDAAQTFLFGQPFTTGCRHRAHSSNLWGGRHHSSNVLHGEGFTVNRNNDISNGTGQWFYYFAVGY